MLRAISTFGAALVLLGVFPMNVRAQAASTVTHPIPFLSLSANQVWTFQEGVGPRTSFSLSLNRNTVTTGTPLNLDNTPTAQLVLEMDESFDGGLTYVFSESAVINGGVIQFTDRSGQLITVEQSMFSSTFSPGVTNWLVTITNSSVPVSIDGTMTKS